MNGPHRLADDAERHSSGHRERAPRRAKDLDAAGITTAAVVRRLARDGVRLQQLIKDEHLLRTAHGFASLARVFPSRVVVVLLDAGASGLASLGEWDLERFTKALGNSELAPEEAGTQVDRFRRLKAAVESGADPEHLTGLELDLGGAGHLPEEARRALREADVETLADWAAHRGKVEIDPKVAQRLTAQTRLDAAGLPHEVIETLVANRITSGVELALLNPGESDALARAAGVTRKDIERWKDLASRRLNGLLDRALLDRAAGRLVVDEPPDPNVKSCDPCPDDCSAFSRFAYFIYLVQKTRLSVQALDQILHQDFMTLSPYDGYDPVPRVTLCLRVLERAFPPPLTAAERMPAERFRVVHGLALLPLGVGEFAAAVAARGTGIQAADLAARLRDALSAAPAAVEPTFSDAERATLFEVLDTCLVGSALPLTDLSPDELADVVTQEIPATNRANLKSRIEQAAALAQGQPLPTFTTQELSVLRQVTTEHLGTRGRQQLGEPLTRAQVQADLLLRDAYKTRSGKSDRELDRLLFIETDLGACQLTSRLAQAILSLQALLGTLRDAAEDQTERTSYRYLAFEQWRADEVGRFYPEFRALARGDVLVGDTGPADRGSYLRDQDVRRASLRQQLDAAQTAIGKARLATAVTPNLSDQAFAGLTPFSQTPMYQPFLDGLALIETFLTADERLVKAQQNIDRDQPALALDQLQRAAADLDALARAASTETSPARTPAEGLYESLLASSPPARKATVANLAQELATGPKAIFEGEKPVQIDGLDLATGQFLDLNEFTRPNTHWRKHTSFKLQAVGGDPHLIKDPQTGLSDVAQSWAYYADNGLASNYSVQTSFRLPQALGVDDLAGVGIRLQATGPQNVLTGYQLVFTRRLTPSPEDEPVSTGNSLLDGAIAAADAAHDFVFGSDDDVPLSSRDLYLVLQKLDGSGNPTDLGQVLVGYDANFDNLHIDREATYELELEARGQVLRGTLRAPGFDPFTLEVTDGTYTTGSFGVVASDNLAVDYLSLSCRIPSTKTAPPFQAKRRLNRTTVSLRELTLHQQLVRRSAQELPAELTRDIAAYTFVERGTGGDPAQQAFGTWLVFPAGGQAVEIERLDRLLELCLEGTFYLKHVALPVVRARAHLAAGDFERAADALRLVYDDRSTGGLEIYPFLAQDPAHRDALGPDARLLRLRLGEIYLKWADWLFRRDTEDTRAAARRLLHQVLALHGDGDACQCDAAVRRLVDKLFVGLSGMRDGPRHALATDLIQSVAQRLRDSLADGPLVKEVLDGFPDDPRRPDPYVRDLRRLDRRVSASLQRRRLQLRERNTLDALTQKTRRLVAEAEVRYAAAEDDVRITLSRPEAGRLALDGAARVRPDMLRVAAQHCLGQGDRERLDLARPPAGARYPFFYKWLSFTLCLPANPLVRTQRRQACLLLGFLTNCRNVLGYADAIVPPLRFEALHRLATGFADLALAAERDLLNFRRDAETAQQSLTEAVGNLAVAEVSVAIEAGKAREAAGDVLLADLQLRQANEQMNHVDQLLAAGLSHAEEAALSALEVAMMFSTIGGIAGSWQSMIGAAAGGGPLALAGAGAGALSSFAGTGAQISQLSSQVASMQASYERREQQWRHELALDQIGVSIGQQAVQQAILRQQLAEQQVRVAEMRRDTAADGLHFLANRFLNEAMFIWMMQTVREEYRTRLNYAISAAYMAERALAFELQEPQRVIRFDYFDPRRDGLLGATQLQTDLATLRNIKLGVTQRKLQLSKTISLRSEMPIEFQRFKEGPGRLPFATLMEWFDADFPGHYLRLIKSVQVTVLALVPPQTGIHATLWNNGTSTVVTGPPEFRPTAVRRDPESVALSSPFQASGVFVLDMNGDLLLPFEGGGVETSWIFELPKAANPFDFDTIADVLLTMEYTALADPTYRNQVIEQRGDTFRADCAHSVRYQLPDEWYHLHNRLSATDPLRVTFELRASNLPPNVTHFKIEHLTLYLVWPDPTVAQDLDVILRFQQEGSASPAAAPVIATQGNLIRTRAAGAPAWLQQFGGQSPLGTWEIEFVDTPATRAVFEQGQLGDILFAISYVGQRIGWTN